MTRLTLLALLLPGTALAHGGHPPVAEAVHLPVHLMIFAGLAVAAVAFAAGRYWRDRT